MNPNRSAPAFDMEELWEDLLAFIEQRSVIPVVGAELLTTEQNGTEVPLYRVVAEQLLARYNRSSNAPALPVLRDGFELSDAVCALAASGRRVADLYRPVHDIVRSVLQAYGDSLPVLRDLAAIRHFDLFVTTTPDDLVVRALNDVRYQGMGPDGGDCICAQALDTGKARHTGRP